MAKKTNYTVNGKDYYRLRRKIGEDCNGKTILKPFYGSCKMEAEEKYKKYIEEQNVSPNISRNESFGKVAKFYTYNIMLHENLSPGTIELYERQYRKKLLNSKIMIRPIKEVGGSDIQEFLNNLAEGKLDGKNIKVTQSSIKSLTKYLKRLFLYLSREGFCKNVMLSVIVPKIKSDEVSESDKYKDIEVFTNDEIMKIIETPNRKNFMFMLALATGLRAGEIMALKYEDFVDGKVRVNKQLSTFYKIDSSGHGEYDTVIKKPKSPSSIRTIPIPKNVLDAFYEHTKEHKKEMMRNGYRTDYLFTTDSGHLLYKGNLRMAWKRHLKVAGVDYKKFHTCRSTYCTILCKKGVPLETASKLMGHSDINITAEFYRFIGQSEMEDAATKIDILFSIKN